MHYINNLINTASTYLTAVSKSIERANLLLIFWKDKTSCISWVTGEIKSSFIKSVTKTKVPPRSTRRAFDSFFSIDTQWNWMVTFLLSPLDKWNTDRKTFFPLSPHTPVTFSCPLPYLILSRDYWVFFNIRTHIHNETTMRWCLPQIKSNERFRMFFVV